VFPQPGMFDNIRLLLILLSATPESYCMLSFSSTTSPKSIDLSRRAILLEQVEVTAAASPWTPETQAHFSKASTLYFHYNTAPYPRKEVDRVHHALHQLVELLLDRERNRGGNERMWNLFASINVPGLLLQEGDQVRDASSFSKLLGQVEVLSVDPQVPSRPTCWKCTAWRDPPAPDPQTLQPSALLHHKARPLEDSAGMCVTKLVPAATLSQLRILCWSGERKWKSRSSAAMVEMPKEEWRKSGGETEGVLERCYYILCPAA